MASDTCPCGTGLAYRACCGRYHRGEIAPTCEALMRSRYSAFARGEVDYLLATSHPDLIEREGGIDVFRRSLREACRTLRYQGLTVREAHEDGDSGQVTFAVRVFRQGRDLSFAERSDFLRDDGRWRYLSGESA
jgi:SEC-C motif-containing protein